MDSAATSRIAQHYQNLTKNIEYSVTDSSVVLCHVKVKLKVYGVFWHSIYLNMITTSLAPLVFYGGLIQVNRRFRSIYRIRNISHKLVRYIDILTAI